MIQHLTLQSWDFKPFLGYTDSLGNTVFYSILKHLEVPGSSGAELQILFLSLGLGRSPLATIGHVDGHVDSYNTDVTLTP